MGSYIGLIAPNGTTVSADALPLECIEQGGRNSSSLVWLSGDGYVVQHTDEPITSLAKHHASLKTQVLIGRAGTGPGELAGTLPSSSDDVVVVNNGVLLEKDHGETPDTGESHPSISSFVSASLGEGTAPHEIPESLYGLYDGVFACTILLTGLGKALLFSNNGGLYLGESPSGKIFATEQYPLRQKGCSDIKQIVDPVLIDIPVEKRPVVVHGGQTASKPHAPNINKHNISEEKLLEYPRPELRRCTKCLLPETMPFIHFDETGECNYCRNYRLRNQPKPKEDLFGLVERYRREGEADCIVPFSGGRDSSYGLHLVVKELGMRPVAYTYDWGMVTDLAHRNVSRMCAALGVKNIVVAADIRKKRDNISRNLAAWLKSPHLGMLSILTAGDKHFFKYIQDIKEQTGIGLNLWGVNPLEVTHFKAGFLGVRPYFAEERVYSSGAMKQLRYHWLRTRAMVKSPGYFNRSLWDTLSGEYYRSISRKEDYFDIFDYWKWDEKQIEDTLDGYGWERAEDTNSTWRIGDGTAGFYNYVYHTVAGFTEHDTFHSNQIREGDITREEGLRLIEEENRPRYQNIKWYLDTLGFDFTSTVSIINAIPKLYNEEQ